MSGKLIKRKEEKPLLELADVQEGKIIIKGKHLRCRWLDSYILVWTKEQHEFERD